MSSLSQFLSQRLARREEEGLLRQLSGYPNLIDFSSNDYLSLARSTKLFELIRQRFDASQLKLNGATGSRLLSGNSELAEDVERQLAAFFKTEASLLFNSGYAANQSVLSAIPQKGDTILYDELAHACIKDGARLSLATRYAFKHNDLDDLQKKIRKSGGGRIFIAVESIYSMDGDECPLIHLVKLAEAYSASIVLDEAHSTGIAGPGGSGLACSLGLQNRIDIRIHTFGKAFGVHGACVCGSSELTKFLINFARPFIYTTALPPHSLVAIQCAMDFIQEHPELARALHENISTFVDSIGIQNRIASRSAIQTALFPGNDRTKSAAIHLQAEGFDVRPILSPTVPKGTERLRICIHAHNSTEEIAALTSALNRLSS